MRITGFASTGFQLIGGMSDMGYGKNAAQPNRALRAEGGRRAGEHATMTGLAVHPCAILAFWALARCCCVAGLEVRVCKVLLPSVQSEVNLPLWLFSTKYLSCHTRTSSTTSLYRTCRSSGSFIEPFVSSVGCSLAALSGLMRLDRDSWVPASRGTQI